MEDLRTRFIARVEEIPSLPRVVQRIVALCNDPMSEIRDFEVAFAADPALGARVLRLVNSGYFSLPNRVSSISRAVTFLGFAAVRAVALSVGAVKVFRAQTPETMDTEEFWSHAVAAAEASRLVATKMRLGPPDAAQTAGLLHDIASLVIHAYFPDDATRLTRSTGRFRVDAPEEEKAVLGTDHAELGSLLLDRWGLPVEVVSAVAHHHGDDETLRSHPTALSVHLAEHLVHRWGVIPGGVEPRPEMSRVGAELVERHDAVVSAMEADVESWVERAHELLG